MTHHPVPPFGNGDMMTDPSWSCVAGHYYPPGELAAILGRCEIYLDGVEVKDVLAYNINAGYVVQGVSGLTNSGLGSVFGRRTLWGKVRVVDPLAVDLAEIYLK